ncbi:MAG TPA: amylo-alpha-1,6-glucosidase [Ktedonobacteraceae bacterium]|nr:amylo-alpha-1,6-glucosidase [Ktedonobacteraceae bacterium]
MPITLDRSICRNLNETISREWLVTNGLGGYAAGTVAGVLTRMEHGLLVAIPPGAITPQLLLAKIDEEVFFDQRTYYLGTNEYPDGTLNPSGFVHLETFRLEEGFPVFTYHLGGFNGIMLEKRIWMEQGQHTTYIQYRVLRNAPHDAQAYRAPVSEKNGYRRYYEYAEMFQRTLTLTLLPFAAYRPYNQPQRGDNDRHFQVHMHRAGDIIDKDASDMPMLLPTGTAGCTIQAWEGACPYHILAIGHPESQVTFLPTGVWYWNFLHRSTTIEHHPATSDLYLPGVIRATLWPDEHATLTLAISAEKLSSQYLHPDQPDFSYKRSIERQRQLLQHALQPVRYFGEGGEAAQAHHLHILPLTTTADPYDGGEEYLCSLLQAGDHFLAHHTLHTPDKKRSIFFDESEDLPFLFADYFHMENRTRDALIALPGLLLATEQFDEALRILRGYIPYLRDGMLPNRLAVSGSKLEASDYESADLVLWFFYALDHYLRVTHNYEFLEEFFTPLKTCIDKYIQGTSHGIRMDANDGLLYVHQPGKALTWMNATMNGIPVTPRIGKPVEINALWYYTLSLLYEWSEYLNSRGYFGHTPDHYHELRTQCQHSFQQRFWYAESGYLYDVVDGPGGNDPALRPNQLFAISLRHSVLDNAFRQAVFDAVTQHLLTPYGLRTLAPHESAYRGHMGKQQDGYMSALHQGSIWSWLIGPYIDALLTMQYEPLEPSQQNNHLCREYLWRKSLQLLEPFKGCFDKGLLGMCPATFDGDAPHNPGPTLASALSIGELLRIYDVLAKSQSIYPEHIFS